jgi:DNA-binding transcriptional ArsR family regulator
MSPRSARTAAPIFAALGEPTRLSLVQRLGRSGPLSITRLAEGGEVTRQAVTKHLEVLERAGLVSATARGRERIWELVPERLDDARAYLDQIEARWDEALGRLRDLVEK